VRRALIAASLLAGAVAGSVVMLTLQSVAPIEENNPGTTVTATTSIASPSQQADPGQTTVDQAVDTGSVPPADQVLLVWTPAGLPAGFADRVALLEDVTAVTTIQGDLVHLIQTESADGEVTDLPPTGYVIPFELIAFDRETYPAFLAPQESLAFTDLLPDQVILGSTSAELRGLGPGGVLTLENGSVLGVTSVVPDVLIGGAEGAVLTSDAERLGVAVERYLLVRYTGIRAEIESLVRAELPDGLAVRVRSPGETPVLRHGDAVLPQVAIKDRFGEFAYRPDDDSTFEIQPEWVDRNIVTAQVPLLGPVTCHRSLMPALTGAMEDLEERNLSFLVESDGFRGCFNPRYIGAGRGISRHAWGAAVDINLGSNPEGLESVQDPRLIEVMESWGFTSGHEWLIPDPGHFEYIRPPDPVG
jgi:hypothetical protein